MGRTARMVAFALLALAIALGPARRAAAQAGDLDSVAPNEDAYSGQRPLAPPPWDRVVGVVLSLGSTMINTVVFPVKLAVGIAGAEIGGVVGAMNGGDLEAAAGVWNVTTDGSYFDTPAALDGREPFYYGGDSR